MRLTLKEIKDRFPEFEYKNYDEDAYFIGYNHDSRDVKKDTLYIPIVGDRFDGHNFIKEALDNGASISLCENSKYYLVKDVTKPIVFVDSIEEGLEKILNLSISDITAPVVAITGSTGKTTTRRMLVHILQGKKKVLSAENTNTVWGNAALLGEYVDEDAIVLECAMDRKGEIAWHVNSVDPDIGVLLNIGYVHAENVGSIEDIFEEKKNLADYMERTGKPLVLNIDDKRLVKIRDGYRKDSPLVTFGKDVSADYIISDIVVNGDGTKFRFVHKDQYFDVELNVFGDGFVYDAMAAIIVSNLLGISFDDSILALGSFENSYGRFEKLEYGDNLVIVNDAYNANPDSMNMALRAFNELFNGDWYKIAILGDMKELGDVSAQKHKELGEAVKECGFNEIYYVGDYYDDFGVGECIASADEVAAMLNSKLSTLKDKKVAILVKGSHSLGLYNIPDFLVRLGAV